MGSDISKTTAVVIVVFILLLQGTLAQKIEPNVVREIEDKSKARVIIMLKDDSAGSQHEKRIEKSRRLQARVLNRFSRGDFQILHRYSEVPAVSGIIKNRRALARLEASPFVENVYIDGKMHATLSESSSLINADLVNDYGYTGRDVGVCILDSGVDYTHSYLGDPSCTITVTTNGTTEPHSVESPHNYPSNYNYTWTITKPGYENIAVHFDRLETEKDYDFVYILDSDDNVVQLFSGTYTDTWSVSVLGDTIKVNLVSDGTIRRWGFEIDSVLNGSIYSTWQDCGRVVQGYDFSNNDYLPFDDNGHGTHVAGIIASQHPTHRGIAYEANIVAGKVLDDNGDGYFSDAAAAIDYCIRNRDAHNIRIISMSLGDSSQYNNPVSCDSRLTAQMISAAKSNGIITVVASGNEAYNNGVNFPACASDAVSVGAVYDADVGSASWSSCTDSSTYADKICCFSNTDEILDVMGPGAEVTSTVPTGTCENCHPTGFDTFGGTSMATPAVSAVAALHLQKDQSLSPDELLLRLLDSNTNITDPGNGLSFPRVDAFLGLSVEFGMNLSSGWNLISVPVVAKDMSADYVLSGINHSHIFSYGSGWFEPTEIENGRWIKMNDSSTLAVNGILPLTPIALNPGWNLVGYPSLEERNITSVFGNVTSVFSYEDNSWKHYNPLMPDNSLEIIKPGFGYWINVNDNITLLIP